MVVNLFFCDAGKDFNVIVDIDITAGITGFKICYLKAVKTSSGPVFGGYGLSVSVVEVRVVLCDYEGDLINNIKLFGSEIFLGFVV